MYDVISKSVLTVIALAAAAIPANANEVSISLRAVVEPRCELVDVVSVGSDPSARFSVLVSCNASHFTLSVVGESGPVPIELRSISGGADSAAVAGNSLNITPRRPGLYSFDLEMADGTVAPDADLTIQIDGF